MRITFLCILSVVGWLCHPAAALAQSDATPKASEPLKVVATIPDLADICRSIGGAAVQVETLVPAGTDPHSLLPKASLLLRLQKADVLLLMGLDYEHAFLPPLLEKVRNPKIASGSTGYVNVGSRIRPLEVPSTLDRGAGADLHPRGNPHFNLDPERARVMGLAIREALAAADPSRSSEFEESWRQWDRKLVSKIEIWKAYLAPLRGRHLVSYHRSWTYFADRFELNLLGEIEPKPGLRPSPKHLVNLANAMIENDARVLLMEPWYPRSDVEKILQLTGAQLVSIATTSGATESTLHYMDWMNRLVEQVGQAYGQPSLREFEAKRAEQEDS